jgi:hypothetical protein
MGGGERQTATIRTSLTLSACYQQSEYSLSALVLLKPSGVSQSLPTITRRHTSRPGDLVDRESCLWKANSGAEKLGTWDLLRLNGHSQYMMSVIGVYINQAWLR